MQVLFSSAGNASLPVSRRQSLVLGVLLLTGALAGCASELPAAAQEKNVTTQKVTKTEPIPPGKEIATVAGGCFWCTEAIFNELKGVEKVEPGYSGGRTINPTYEQVCSGLTGHAEAIQIVYDPKVISYHDLLSVFFATHDPTTLNRQGPDVGTQYRSSVFFHSPAQKEVAAKVIQEVNKARLYPNPVVTEIVPFTKFYVAEDYHKNYFARNSGQAYCQAVIAPKLAKFRQYYRSKLKR